jgi:hypothetical protein
MPVIDLSRVHYDADAILEQLQLQAEASDTFRDFYTGSTGYTLLQTQAAVGALNNYASESALQEAMLLTAKNDSSVYMYTAGQGVRVGRRGPSQCTATLTRPTTDSAQSIPEFSQFSVGGVFMFNRDAIIFPIGVAVVNVTLFQGKVISRTVFGIGEDFQVWASPEQDFEISDQDVQVRMNNVPVPVVTNGLWNYKDSTKDAIQDWTSSKGHLDAQVRQRPVRPEAPDQRPARHHVRADRGRQTPTTRRSVVRRSPTPPRLRASSPPACRAVKARSPRACTNPRRPACGARMMPPSPASSTTLRRCSTRVSRTSNSSRSAT